MLLPYLSKTIEVHELENDEFTKLVFNKIFDKIKQVQDKVNQKHLIFQQNPAIILIPITAFDYMIADFPDIDDEEEMDEWVQEYFSHHALQNTKDYKLDYLHLNPESNEHKILIVSILISEYQKLKDKVTSVNNPVFIGSGIESLGLAFSLNDNVQNKKNIIIDQVQNRTIILEYNNAVLTGFHEFDSLDIDIDNIVQQDDNTIIWNLYETDDNTEKIEISEKEIALQDFRKTGIMLNYYYKITKPINLLEQEIIDNSAGNIERRNALTLGSFLLAIFMFFYIIPVIAGSFNVRSIAKLDNNLTLIEDKLTLIAEQQGDIKHLKKQLLQKTEITGARSHFSGYLELVGRNIPMNVQLDKLDIAELEDNIIIIINGNANDKTSIAELLSNFEQEKYFKEVDLNYIETQKNNTNDKKSTANHIFEIKVTR